MRLRTKVVITLTVLVIAVGVFNTVSWSRRPQEVRLQTPGNEKTSALRIEKVEVLSDAVKVSLKNVSSKTINGIQLSINGGRLQIDLLGAEEVNYQKILPGGIYEQFLSRRTLSQPLEISVLAVTFEDGDSDGDPVLALQIIDMRRGVNKQLKRINSLLDAALRSSEVDPIKMLNTLKLQIEELPIETSTESSAVTEGEQQAKMDTLNRIESLKQRQVDTGSFSVRPALTNMKNRHDKQIQKGP